jgi:uncharacterized protein DUF6152
MKRTVVLMAAVGVALAVASQPARGHHGGAAYDQTKSVTFEGTVTEMQFANPHVLVYWDVKNGEAAGEKWSGWLTAPTKLARAGWTKKTLSPGDHIVISGSPHKDGSHVLQIRKLVGPDGKELPLFEQ